MTISANALPARTSGVPANLVVAARRIDDELRRGPGGRGPMALSAEARASLEVVHAEYLADVGREAVRLARKDGLSTVDRSHMEKAAQRIGSASGSGALPGVCNTVGGLFAGAALAAAYMLVFESTTRRPIEFITVMILSILGFSLLATGVTLTVVRRR